MTNPTRQEIVNAYEALSDITYLADTYLSSISGRLDETRELRQTILRALPPLPRPTMAEIRWNDDVHYLAEAAHPDHGKVIMVGRKGNLLIDVFYFSGMRNKVSSLYATDLTPTGKRYTLTEVQE